MDSNDIIKIENQTEFLTPQINSIRKIQDVGVILQEMVEIEKKLIQYIAEAEKNIAEAEKKQTKAKNYKTSPLKIGSGDKKARLIVEAQEAMQAALNSMQKVQSVMFKFQQILVTFTQKCMSICIKNERNLNDLANILWSYRKSAETPQEVRAAVEEIYNEVVEQQKYLYEQEMARKALEAQNTNGQVKATASKPDVVVQKDNSKLYLSCAVIIGIAIVISSVIK